MQWALKTYNKVGYRTPETVITDKDGDLKSCVASIWPKVNHVLSAYNLYHTMLSYCKNQNQKKVSQFKKDFMD